MTGKRVTITIELQVPPGAEEANEHLTRQLETALSSLMGYTRKQEDPDHEAARQKVLGDMQGAGEWFLKVY